MRAARPSVEIETIEVPAHPARALRDGVFMIPALILRGAAIAGQQRWHHAPSLDELLSALDTIS